MDQKKKTSNFTKCEIDTLVDEVECHKELLFGKLSGTITSDIKKACWSDITAKVNAVSGGVVHTEKSIKKKWIDMCSLAKKKEASRRREMQATGGGECSSSSLCDTEAKVVALLSNEAIEGVCGGTDVGIGIPETDQPVVVCMDMLADQNVVACSSDFIPDVGMQVAVDAVEKKMASGGKRRRENDGMEELTRLERKRLEIEEERLAVEKRRLAVEEERLKLEQEKWMWMKSLRTAVVSADE